MPNERDRQKVVVQITQNLSSRVRNAHAFELPSLYIPSFAAEGSKASRIDNNLEQTCEQIETSISQNVQNNLNKYEEDCSTMVSLTLQPYNPSFSPSPNPSPNPSPDPNPNLNPNPDQVARIDALLATDVTGRKHNRKAASYGYAFLLLSLHLPVLALCLLAQWARLEWCLQRPCPYPYP